MADDVTNADFDEAWYLTAYPDVAEAVSQGGFASGRVHWEAHGRTEGRSARPGQAQAGPMLDALSDDDRRSQVDRIWSIDREEQAAAEGWYWMAHPAVQSRLNRLASGDPAIDAYQHLANALRQRGWALPIAHALSLGCGFGGLERDLASRGIVAHIDGYDLASEAIADAQRQAESLGLSNLHYHVADLETANLPPGEVDVVFAHQSVHHIERLEQMFEKVSAALRPGGIFHLHEFAGPIRFQWTDTQIALTNEFLDSLPDALCCLPSGRRRARQGRATVAAMIEADPSEAIRSSDIERVLGQHFQIIEARRLGGTLAHLALAGIAQNFLPDNPSHLAALERLFALEDQAMADGRIGSDFVVLTAMKA